MSNLILKEAFNKIYNLSRTTKEVNGLKYVGFNMFDFETITECAIMDASQTRHFGLLEIKLKKEGTFEKEEFEKLKLHRNNIADKHEAIIYKLLSKALPEHFYKTIIFKKLAAKYNF